MRNGRRGAFTLTDLLTAMLIFSGLCLMIVPPLAQHVRRRDRVAACADNLSKLCRLAHLYRVQFGPRIPRATGGAFWRALETAEPPLVQGNGRKVFLCPVKADGPLGELHYWGPGKRALQLNDMQPLGSDAMGESPNHDDGGNLLRKSGDVIEISHEMWTEEFLGWPIPCLIQPIP